MFFSFFKQTGFLTNVRIDPYTDMKSAVMIPFQHAFWIREGRRIPLEVTPLVGIHPVAVKMEDMQRDLPVCHSLDKAGSRCLVVIGSKGCCQPQTEGPRRRQGRFTGQVRVFFYGSHRSLTADHIVIKAFSLYRELDPLYFLAGNLIRHIAFVVHQDTVSFVCHIKRNILISDLAGCTAVLVPHLHDLSVFHKRGETLAKAVNIFIHIQKQLIQHIIFSGLRVLHIGQVSETGLGQEGVSLIKSHLIGTRRFVDDCF